MLPPEFNIQYYIGDRYELVVNPKTNDGSPYDLTGFTANFVISDELSKTPKWSIDGLVTVDNTKSTLTLVISPSVGDQLQSGKRYYYDVEIRRSDEVYTLLRGQIAATMGVNRVA